MSTFSYNEINYNILNETTCEVASNPGTSGAISIPNVAINTGTSYIVVSIGNQAFANCSGLTSVDLSACTSLTSIGNQAFYNCSGLATVSFPLSLTSIGTGAFLFCSGLTIVDLSNTSLTSIGDYAFRFCSDLTTVFFPDSLTSIGTNAFEGCSGLTIVDLSNTSLTSIGFGTFYNCSGLATVSFPLSLTSIGDYAFEGCSGLPTVTFPASLTSIGTGAFGFCSGLTTVNFPASLTSIGNEAFVLCNSLTTVTFPASLTSIGFGTFYLCSLLNTLNFNGNSLPTIQSNSFLEIASGATAYMSTLAYVSSPASVTSLMIQGITIVQTDPPTPVIPCFLKGSKILTNKGYLAIEYLRKGDLVKTIKDDYQPIYMIGKKELYHGASQERWKNQLYVCKKEKYPELLEELVITGCHSILVDDFISAEERENTIKINGDTYVTDNKYRLPACVDERTEVYPVEGSYTIYHLALEHGDKYMNYGIYANGLLVETCSKRYLTELAEMEEVK